MGAAGIVVQQCAQWHCVCCRRMSSEVLAEAEETADCCYINEHARNVRPCRHFVTYSRKYFSLHVVSVSAGDHLCPTVTGVEINTEFFVRLCSVSCHRSAFSCCRGVTDAQTDDSTVFIGATKECKCA